MSRAGPALLLSHQLHAEVPEFTAAAEIIAEDAQIFASRLENGDLSHLSGPDAVRLFGKRLRDLCAELRPPLLTIFERSPVRLQLTAHDD